MCNILDNDIYDNFMAFVITFIIILIIFNFYKKEISPLSYGLLGLVIFLFISIAINYNNDLTDIKSQIQNVQIENKIIKMAQKNQKKDIQLDNDTSGPFDGLEPDEMKSRLQYLYHATSHPQEKISYINYKTEHDNMIQRDGSSLSSGDQSMIARTSAFYPDLTENQINARDCMNDMGPDSCFQSPNMFQSLENGGVNSSASILKDGLNENNIGQLVREDFKCPRLVADTPPLEPLFINAPSTPDQTQYDITHLPCRGCTTDTCVNCHEHNDLFI